MPPKVKRLKLNAPKRRESARVKQRATSTPSTPTTASSASSAGDTIEVAQKSSDGPLQGAASETAETAAGNHAQSLRDEAVTGDDTHVVVDSADRMAISPTPVPVETGDVAVMIEQAKPSTQQLPENADDEMVDEDDAITEYDFSKDKDSAYEDDESENPRGIFKDVTTEIITISSDDEAPEETLPVDQRPWLNDKGNDKDSLTRRAEREKMYALQRTIENKPFGGSWETTEVYQEQMDQEMEEYIKDFPLDTWTVGQQEAKRAFDRMMGRKRMRSFGVPIFQQQHVAEIGMQSMHAQQMPMHPRHGSHGPQGHHQMSVQQQQLPQQQMPPPQMMQHGGMPYGPPSNQQYGPYGTYGPPGSQPYGPPGGQAYRPPPVQPYGPPPGHMQAQVILPPNQAMRQVGVDIHGQPLYQPVPPMHQPPPQSAPTSRAPSRPHAPSSRAPSRPRTSEKRKSSHAVEDATSSNAESTMGGYLPLKGGPQINPAKRQKRDAALSKAPEPLKLPVAESETDPTTVPPYPTRTRPANEPEKKGYSLPRRGVAQTFPWNRVMDFVAEKAVATWDRSIYSNMTLSKMDEVRKENSAYLIVLEEEDAEKQREYRRENNDDGKPKWQSKRTKNVDAGQDNSPADWQTKGFSYASSVDEFRSHVLNKTFPSLSSHPTVEEIMHAADSADCDLSVLKAVEICWHPVKKGPTQRLKQVTFSILDSIRTRQQLMKTPILTLEAAENIIDFCPDLVWRDTLLRITSETPMQNFGVRNRMCQNGFFIDKSSMTKRITCALGQTPPSERKASLGLEGTSTSTPGVPTSKEFYEQNVKDYENYQTFFGKGPALRKGTLGRPKKGAHRFGIEDSSSGSADSRPVSSGSDGSLVVDEQKQTQAFKDELGGAALRLQVADQIERAMMESKKLEKGKVKSKAKGKGKAKAGASVAMGLDGADDEDAMEIDEEEGVKVTGKGKERALDEVSEQSDGELDRLVSDDDD